MESEERVSSLAAFVPDLMIEWLRRGVPLPWAEERCGTFLLSDVRAFTTHVEHVNARGVEAIEAFNAVMHRYMDLHVRTIRAHGGDIIDMAGDSFLCLWAGDGSDAQQVAAARSAATAALAIQAQLDGFEVTPGIPFEVRIGIATGRLDATLVGEPGSRCELLIGGPAINTVVTAERESPPGAVAADGETIRLLGPGSSILPLAGGLWVLRTLPEGAAGELSVSEPLDPVADDVVLAQAPRIARAVGGRVHHWQPEFRRLSIVLALLPELRSQPVTSMQAVVAALHRVVDRYDGDGWMSFDGKGSMFVAIFGAPFAAHENDAERAVAAGIEIAEAINAITPVSVGVATGRSLHGIFGNAQRRAVTIAGEVVNVASRLANSSDDRVLCDYQTATMASNRFSFAVMNPILVKGKHERVSVFRPIERITEEAPSGTLVRGRANEHARLQRLIEDTTGEHQAIVLIGEAGMGKSTLVAELVSSAEHRGRPILTARADSIDQSAPYAPWASVVRQVLALGRKDAAGLAIARARKLLEADHAPMAPLLGDVLGGTHDDEVTAGLSRDRRVAATAGVIAELCCVVADPYLLVVEDAHWYDASSLAVLEAIRRHPQRPRMIVTSRHRRPELDDLLEAESTETLELGVLDRGSVAEMIADRLGVSEVPDALSDFVFERTNGQPLFCDGLVRNMIEDGLVRVAGGRVKVGDLDETLVPSTLEGVVVTRFDRLPVDDQRCLKAAAVVGTVVDPRTVSACLGADQDRQLDRLVRSGMLRRNGPDLEFAHVISRDVVYALMAGAQRAELHRCVAAHLERNGSDNPRQVGHHWLHAGETDRAITFLTAAADAALHTGSFVDARSLYDQVDELRGTPDGPGDQRQDAVMRIRRATASFYLGDMQRAVTDLEAAVSVLDRSLPAADVPSSESLQSSATQDHSPLDVDDRRALLDAYQRLCQLNYLRGAPALDMHHGVTRALELAEQLADTNAEAWACAQLSAVCGMLGRTDQLEQYGRRAMALVESGQAEHVASDVWRTLGVAYSGLGQWDAALAALDHAAAQAQAGRQAGIWQTRAAIYLCAGDFTNAEPEWRRAAEAGEAIGNRVQVYWSRLDEIQTLIGRNRINDAGDALMALEAEFGEPADPLGRIEYHYTAALVHAAQGNHAAAAAYAAVVMQMVESVPPSGFHWVEFCSGVVEVHLAALTAGRTAGASPDPELVARIEDAVAVLNDLSMLFLHVAPRVDLSLGLLAANQGRIADARELLARARDQAQRAHLDFDDARSTVLFESLSDSPDASELDRAAAVFDRLGAARWLARVDLVRQGVRIAAPG